MGASSHWGVRAPWTQQAACCVLYNTEQYCAQYSTVHKNTQGPGCAAAQATTTLQAHGWVGSMGLAPCWGANKVACPSHACRPLCKPAGRRPEARRWEIPVPASQVKEAQLRLATHLFVHAVRFLLALRPPCRIFRLTFPHLGSSRGEVRKQAPSGQP